MQKKHDKDKLFKKDNNKLSLSDCDLFDQSITYIT